MKPTHYLHEIKEIHLKTKWYEAIKKTPISFGILFLLLLGGPIACLFIDISTVKGKAFFVMAIFSFLFFILINIPTLLKLLKPIEYVVSVNRDLLTIYKNGKKMYSITSQETNRIVLTAKFGNIIGFGIYKVEPKFFSSGDGVNINLSFIPKNDTLELVKLLKDFYGEQRLLELTHLSLFNF